MPLEPGTIVTDLEGYDLGDRGAVVLSSDGPVAELLRLDTRKTLKVNLDETPHQTEEPVRRHRLHENYDELALDSPELHSIRRLPTYWPPRDLNSPSSITDTIWRPEPINRRWQRRYYSYGERSHAMAPTSPRARRNRRAALYPLDVPVPQHEAPEKPYARYWTTPVRVQLQAWEEHPEDVLPPDVLLELSDLFWQGYRTKRQTYLPERGNRQELHLVDWALMFQDRMGLDRLEMELLFQYMVKLGVIGQRELDLLIDSYDSKVVYDVYRRQR